MGTIALETTTFADKVKEGIVLVDFWAEWCGPCRAFAPVYEKASERHADVVFGKVDTEAEPELAEKFQIRAIPTLMVFRDGIILFAQPGVLPGEALDRLVAEVKKLDMDEVRREVAKAEASAGPAAADVEEPTS
jgi:thioredoxin